MFYNFYKIKYKIYSKRKNTQNKNINYIERYLEYLII